MTGRNGEIGSKKPIGWNACRNTIHLGQVNKKNARYENEKEYESFMQFKEKLQEIMEDPLSVEIFINHLRTKEDIGKVLKNIYSGKDKAETENLLWKKFI